MKIFIILAIISFNVMAVDSTAISFVKSNEGFIAVSKWDCKQFSWGFGTKAPREGARITRTAALYEMILFLKKKELYLIKIFGEKYNNLSSNRKAALLDLVYNAGSLDEFPRLKKLIKEGNFIKAAEELSLTSSDPRVKEGLRRRSEKRKALWLK